ncbi:HAD family hydrolase [Frigoriflavimonas asaccharolytica]|uniref:Putative hydrolase of the HAD superfamily n=1 Tax=Frigoriflavimonas asaccharolytica TaxID=2735899 RepID=A0A8J8GCM0_9FLAO|nr:HAD family hydrolase [Frigoriflavimonas asaccharolytica]NRS93262.1 putative hydrolase of the HAD superfamily [Frigoriflavimonas asaccharolytica]
MNIEIEIAKYQHFSFDLWLTIIKSNPDFKVKRDQLLKDHFSIDASFDEVRKAVRYYDVLLNKISEKTGRHIERETAYLLILNALGKKFEDVTNVQLNLYFQEMDQLFLENLPVILWDNIEDQLIRIKNEGKTSSILSNTAFIRGETLEKMLQKLGISSYFSFKIFSDEVKISKPNPNIFDLVHQSVKKIKQVEKNEILHIGDNAFADFQGAKNFGFNAQLVEKQ